MWLLANRIHVFLQSVSEDLAPLSSDLMPPIGQCSDEFFIEHNAVELKLSTIIVNKIIM